MELEMKLLPIYIVLFKRMNQSKYNPFKFLLKFIIVVVGPYHITVRNSL